MSETAKLVVESRVREIAAAKELRVGGDFIDALSARVAQEIEQASRRCLANNRKTLGASDL